MTHGYHTKQEKIGDWILRDEVGNPFSIMTMDGFNPVLSAASESAGTPEKSKALFKKFAGKAHELGMKVIVDFIPWLAPDAINAENLHWTFHRRLEPWQNQKFRSLSELDKFEFIKELLRERKNYFFAVRIGQGNEEEIVLVRHLQGMGRPNVDEAILNPLEEEVMEYYLRSLRNLIDLGVDKVRVDLGGNLLLWNLGSYVSDFGKNPEAAHRLEQREEPWQRILRETLEYARTKKTKFEFIMEAYHPDEQNFMAELATRYEGENDPMGGSVRVYFKEIFSRLLEMRNGSRAQALDENIQEALFVRFHPDPKRRRVKFMVFPSNFDQTPWSAMNFTRDALALFSVLAYLGEDFDLNVMVMLRDLLGHRGNLPPIPGGDRKSDRSSDLEGENAHPFPTADEIEILTDPEKLEAAITASPVAQFMREFSAVVGQNRQINIQFLDNSNRDRFITLAWKTQSDDWILLAKNLKPRHGQTLSLDFIEFPNEALKGTRGSFDDWRVFDPLSGQTAQSVIEYHEGKPYHRLRGNLIFADRDYKFLVLKNYKNLPIPESLFWGNIETDPKKPEGMELHSLSEVRATALAGELESKIHSHLLHIRGLMNRKPWRFYDVEITSREAVVSEIQKGFHSIEAILEQTYREYRQRTGGHPSGWVDILQKTEKAAYQFVLILTILDELHSEKFVRLRSSDKPPRELRSGKGTARRLILLGNQNEPSYNVDVISRWKSQDKHEARFEIQILKPVKSVMGRRKTTQSENTLTSLRIDYETRGQASFDFPDAVRDLLKLDDAEGFHGRRIKNLKNPVTFTDFILLLD
ncbi:MAG TPA: hypothetical protein VD913_03155, partial [bacterium]|nr:hypothetical protein [bacterium]